MAEQTETSDILTKHQATARWLPLLVGALLCSLVGALWWGLDQHEQAHRQNTLENEAKGMAAQLEADLLTRIPALQRMARRWERRGGTPREEFISDATAYFSDTPGYQALNWVDRDFFLRWVVPLAGREQVQDLNLTFEPTRRNALEKARTQRAPTMTGPLDLITGAKGFQLYFPLYVQDDFQGCIVAVFRFRDWLEAVLGLSTPQVAKNFAIELAMDGVPVFASPEWAALERSGLHAVATTEIKGHRFSLHLRPTPEYVAQSKTALPRMAAALSALLAILVAVIVYFYQKTLLAAWHSQTAHRQMEAAAREHEKTAEQLRQVLSRLDMATKAGGIGIWSWEVATGALSLSERMYALYEIPDDAPPTYATWRQTVHPDDLPAVESLLRNAVEGKAVFNTEFRIILPSGAERHLAATARVERNQAGAALRLTGISWDVTAHKQAEETLKQSEEQIRLLLNSTAEGIYGIDLDGNCTFANPACLRMLGYTYPGQVLGKNMHNLIHHSHADGSPLDVKDCYIYRAYREGSGMHRDDEVLWRANGTSFPAEYWSYPQIVHGKVTGAVVTFTDITERKHAEMLLATERQRLASILEGTNVGTWEWNVQTGETVFNERWAEIIGYTLAELAPTSIETWMRFAHPDDLSASSALLQKHFNHELPYYECEARMRHKNGEWVWVLDRGKVATWTADGKPLIISGTHQDITDRKLAEEEIRHLATHDVLTDLPSLRLAMDRLTMALNQARRHQTLVAVMFIDLDGFKAVNDTLGHDAGDQVLREVAQRLLACARATDTVSRVGGDEFLLVATELRNAEDAAHIAEKILRSIGQPILCKEQPVVVGASIGIALFPTHNDNMDHLIKLADKAMYQVKNSGKNNFAFAAPE